MNDSSLSYINQIFSQLFCNITGYFDDDSSNTPRLTEIVPAAVMEGEASGASFLNARDY